jgi:hypothetical protein
MKKPTELPYSNMMKKIFFSAILVSSIFSLHNLRAQDPFYYGEFRLRKIVSSFDTIRPLVNYHATSMLFTDSVNETLSSYAGSLGTVYFNGTSLNYNSAIKLYFDTLQRRTNEGLSWQLAGSGGMPSFTTSVVDSFPYFTNADIVLPDTVHKSDSLYLVFDSTTYTDRIELAFWDGNPRVICPYNKNLPGTQTSVSILSSELSLLGGETVYITLSFVKQEFKILNNFRFKFEKRFDIVKTAILME